jgi:Tfp pilus assembly protein PilO
VTQRNSILVAVVATLAILGAYWHLALGPQREKADTLAAQVAAKQAELSDAESQVATYEAARGSYRRNYATLARLGKAVPADDDVRSLVVQLDAAAKGANVDFRSIELEAGSSGGPASSATGATATTASTTPGAVQVGSAGFSAMPFSFAFRGSFHNLTGFFSRLERFVTVHNSRIKVTGRLLRVESITLKPDGAGFPSIRAEIGASSYLVPPTQGVLAGATAQGPAPAPSASTATPASTSSATTPPTTTETTAAATGGTQ